MGVVDNQAIIAKTTWFYLAQVGLVWLCETRFYLLQLFKMSLSFTVDSAIRGHHIYKTIWMPQLDETLSCEAEPGNIHNPYAVAVKRTSDNTIVGHVPRKVSAVCSLFLRRGTMVCVVNIAGYLLLLLATAILFGHDMSVRFNQKIMRDHLAKCFQEKSLQQFPAEIM